MKKALTLPSLLAGACLLGGAVTTVNGQSADALIDKLVQKGVLSQREAQDLRDEADKGFTQALSVKTGMSDWVHALKFNGDVRLRYDGVYADHPGLVDRNRMRYRLRFGVTAALMDNFEAGLRLTSGEAVAGGFADPISSNTSFSDNGSKKLVALDLAYGKWSPLNGPDWNLALTGGKMENPFVFSDCVFDGDYTPEGLAQQVGYTFSDRHSVRLNLGEFFLEERELGSRDAYLLGAQARWEAAWTPKLQSSIGLAALAVSGKDALVTANVPDRNKGNKRNGAGQLLANYNPIVVDGAVTWSLESFPGYTGFFPIRLGGDYLHNPGADSMNEGYSVGLTLGKSGKKRTWDLSYRWKTLEGDCWYEEMVDSDTGAYYAAPGNLRGAAGYGSGTNLRGHVLRASYSPFDSLTFAATYLLMELIEEPVALNHASETGRLQLDASWKF